MQLYARLYRQLDVRAVRGADTLLTLNATTARAIEEAYGRSGARSTYAGIDTAHFRPYTEEELDDLRSVFGPGPFAVHSTDLGPIKRTDLALRAFARTRTGMLLVTSTNENPERVAAFHRLAAELNVSDRVRFLGFVPYGDLPRIYALANVLLQTGTDARAGATSMSLPVKEALACGTPAVRSRATDEDVEHGHSGFLVDPEDVDETARRLSALIEDGALSRAMGEVGRQRVVGTFTWDRVADVLLEEVA